MRTSKNQSQPDLKNDNNNQSTILVDTVRHGRIIQQIKYKNGENINPITGQPRSQTNIGFQIHSKKRNNQSKS